MRKQNPITKLMKAEKINQEFNTDWFEPSEYELRLYYGLLNKYVFRGMLTKPKLELLRLRGAWGIFTGDYYGRPTISMTNRFPTKQFFVMALAHEMVHQHQWDIIGPKQLKEGKKPSINHGPTFYNWRDTLSKFGIPLTAKY